MLLCIQPTFKIVTVACLSSPPCSDCIRFYKSSLLTPAIRDRFFKRLQPKSCRTSKSKSSNALIRPKGLSFCRDVGWSNALSLGSTVAAGWPRISRTSTETPSLFSASPRFASCSEGFVRVHKLFGRTLIREIILYIDNERHLAIRARSRKLPIPCELFLSSHLSRQPGRPISGRRFQQIVAKACIDAGLTRLSQHTVPKKGT